MVGKRMARYGIIALFALLAACGKPDRAMPLTREHVLHYKEKLVESQNSITAKDREKARTSPEWTARLFAKTFVAPLEEMGYSYDKTIHSFAEKLIEGKMPAGDREVTGLAEGVIVMAKSTEDFAAKNGFISGDTKKLLDKINLK